MLESFDKNGNFWLRFEQCTHSSNPNDLQESLSIEIANTCDTPKRDKVPDETIFIMSRDDALYLYNWLKVFIELTQ